MSLRRVGGIEALQMLPHVSFQHAAASRSRRLAGPRLAPYWGWELSRGWGRQRWAGGHAESAPGQHALREGAQLEPPALPAGSKAPRLCLNQVHGTGGGDASA